MRYQGINMALTGASIVSFRRPLAIIRLPVFRRLLNPFVSRGGTTDVPRRPVAAVPLLPRLSVGKFYTSIAGTAPAVSAYGRSETEPAVQEVQSASVAMVEALLDEMAVPMPINGGLRYGYQYAA